MMMCLLAASCARHNEPERLPDKGPFTIFACYGITDYLCSQEQYDALAEAGFTIDLPVGLKSIDEMKAALDYARNSGIQVMIGNDDIFDKQTEEIVSALHRHPALYGYFILDEPPYVSLPNIRPTIDAVRKIDTLHPCYVNLFPDCDWTGVKEYADYVEHSVEVLDSKLLSFDKYPIMDGYLWPSWYHDLQVVSDVAKKHDIPFWAFALLSPHWDYPTPTLNHLRLQQYANLCYGAAGIEYYTYCTPRSTDYHLCPIDRQGRKSFLYDLVKEMNSEIHGLSCVFKGSTNHRVRHFGYTGMVERVEPLTTMPEGFLKVDGGGRHGLVSEFDNDGHRFIVFQNCELDDDMMLDVAFEPTMKRILKDRTITPADSYTYPLRLNPGDIAVFMK